MMRARLRGPPLSAEEDGEAAKTPVPVEPVMLLGVSEAICYWSLRQNYISICVGFNLVMNKYSITKLLSKYICITCMMFHTSIAC